VTITGADPAAAAIARTLAETVPLADLSAAVTGGRPGFPELYRQWFGDPWEIPAFAQGVALPADAAWPFEGARRYTGGPHLGAICSQQDILAASGLDFGGESHEVLAMAEGRYLGRGETTAAGLQAGKYVLLEHEGGVQVMYWHLGGFTPEVLALAPGTAIPKGFPVGWSGRSGNQSAVHLHVELRRGAVASNPYSGVRVPWDGQMVDRWTVRMFRWPGRSDRGISYRGSAVRGATHILTMGNCTCDQVSADAFVSSEHPDAAAPCNGMDANTVLANYPDVGLVPSSNARTTVLWSTGEKAWRNRLPWYYLVDARCGDVVEVSLDGVTLFSAPACARAVWLSAGDHRLTWRYREDGSGGAPVTVVPWPFDSPGCAATALGAPPTQPAPPAAPHDDAAAESVGDGPDDVAGEAGVVVTATWRLRNTGTVPWGDGYRLTFADGWPLGAPEGVLLPAAAPGDAITVTLPITVPSLEGRAYGLWRLRNPDGVAFGPPLAASVGVMDATPEATPTPLMPGGSPEAPELLEPVAREGEVAYLGSRDVTLRWSGLTGAEAYVVHLSLLPVPADDPSPVYREQLAVGVHERRLLFGVDVPRMYWQVTALTAQGEVASRVGIFGLDTEAPVCSAAISALGDGGARVTWRGEDTLSGIATYEVAYREAEHGEWRLLLRTNSAGTLEAALAAPRGGEYMARCRAWDAAGNGGPWSPDAASAVLGTPVAAQVAGSGPAVTAIAGGDIFVEMPICNVGGAPGDMHLSLLSGPASGKDGEVHRWDVADLAPGRTVTLTAVISGPAAATGAGAALDGEYRFSAHSLDGAETGPGSPVTVCLALPDAYEVWDAGDAPAGAPLEPGWRQTRGLHVPWDVDYARVTVEGGRRYMVWTEGLGPAADTVVELYDPQGSLVAWNDDANGLESRIEWTAPANGAYRVVVRSWAPGSEGCDAGYTLRLQTEPAAPEVAESAGVLGKIRLPLVGRAQ
jgi:hypothetical protein